MLQREWCDNGQCSDCTAYCRLDESMPCSPDCENITEDGAFLIEKCTAAKCDALESLLKEMNL